MGEIEYPDDPDFGWVVKILVGACMTIIFFVCMIAFWNM